MNLDDRLDALLSASGWPNAFPLPDDDDARALAPLLAAAQRLAPLREAQPSARFADELEHRVLAHAASGRTPYAPTTATGTAAADADGAAPTAPMLVPNGVPAVDDDGEAPTRRDMTVPLWSRAPRTAQAGLARPARRGANLPVWARALAAACVLLALGSGLFAAGANAQPGSPLFGLHRVEQWARVSLASPEDRARLHLQYAGDALAALDRAVAQHSGDPSFAGALDTLRSELAAASSSIAALPAGQTHDTLAAQLATLQQRARDDLRAALPSLGWGDRVATTAALGVLGERVPHITGAAIHAIAGQDGQDGQSAQGATHGAGARPVQIVVSGGGFAAGARLVIDGQSAGTVLAVTDGTLIAQVSLDPTAAHIASIGVENPDGTAAQTTDVAHGAAVTATPMVAPTATPHRGGRGGRGGHG